MAAARCAVLLAALAAPAAAAEAWASGAALPSDFQATDYGTAACSNSSLTGQCCCESKQRGDGSPCEDVELLLCFKQAQRAAVLSHAAAQLDSVRSDGSQLWIIFCGALVFFMQCGFAMLETGAVRSGNTLNIIFKNLMDACIGAISFYCLGYGFAYGTDKGHFIGASNFFLMREPEDESGQHSFFFQFAFAATAATITSGSVCERTKLTAYFLYASVLTTWVYPVVVHWVWSADGWLSAFAPADVRLGRNGMIDYAGSGVVHTVGGFAGLCGAIFVGPRLGRFAEDGTVQKVQGQSAASRTMLSALGVLILWFGWYGFNCGSTLAFDGRNAGKVATTTTLGAAMGSLTAVFIGKIWEGTYDLDLALNGVLAGLVSITAGCSVVDEWCALLIGAIGGVVYLFASKLLLVLRIDDPLNAWPVHGACGVWGCIAAGIFAQQRNLQRAYGFEDGAHDVTRGMQLGVQLAGVTSIIVWTCANCCLAFFIINKTIGMRVEEEVERKGLDQAEHGAPDYQRSFMGVNEAGRPAAPTVHEITADEARADADEASGDM